MSWVRGGHCCRCGECCIGNPFDPDNPTRSSELMKRTPEQPGRCPLLHFTPDDPSGATVCLGHLGYAPAGQEDPYYMAGCNVWPTDPRHIENYPSCTYTFAWVDD